MVRPAARFDQPQIIREGSIVLIDDGCTVEGYQSDISRTFVIGKPTDKMKRVFDTVRKAQAAALQAAKPGVPCQAVDAAARKVVDDAGFGPGYTTSRTAWDTASAWMATNGPIW